MIKWDLSQASLVLYETNCVIHHINRLKDKYHMISQHRKII